MSSNINNLQNLLLVSSSARSVDPIPSIPPDLRSPTEDAEELLDFIDGFFRVNMTKFNCVACSEMQKLENWNEKHY